MGRYQCKEYCREGSHVGISVAISVGTKHQCRDQTPVNAESKHQCMLVHDVYTDACMVPLMPIWVH
jgi:hypothetical protein